MSITRTATVGALSLIAAGAIGGGFALAMSQGGTSQPTELRQVVQTTTATPTVATTTHTATRTSTTTAAAPKVTTTKRKASVAPRVQQVAPEPTPSEPTPSETTPQPVTTTPAGTTPVGTPIPRPPAGDEGNAPRYCGGVTVCTNTP